MKTIVDHADLIDALGGNTSVATHLETPEDPCQPVRVGQWKRSRSIPNEYWPELIIFAQQRGLQGIDADWMMNSAPKRKRAVVGFDHSPLNTPDADAAQDGKSEGVTAPTYQSVSDGPATPPSEASAGEASSLACRGVSA
jgi:hypothetical protein